MSQDIHGAIKDFLATDVAPGRALGDDDSLLDAGVLDSMAMTKLISFIEERFAVTIDDDDWEPDNFETVGAIAALVQKKRG